MKTILSLTLFLLTAVMAVFGQYVPATVCLFAGSAALIEAPSLTPGALFTVTLTPVILLQQTIKKLFVKVAMLSFFAHEFTSERLKLNQTVTGKIRLRPATSTYDGTTGYKNGSQEGRDLLLDVSFVMDQHIHITLKVDHLNYLADSIQDMNGHMEDSASVLGKTIARYILGKVNSRSFTNSSTYTAANSDKDALNAIRKALNLRGVPDGRFGIVNSDVAETLDGDSRITNRYDGRSQSNDASGLIRLSNVSGFGTIIEDPELSTGNDAAEVAVVGEADDETFTLAAHGFLVNDRVHLTINAGGTGIASGYFFVKTVPTVNTFTLSATRGGSTAAFSTDITDATVGKAENISGIFGTREAIAFKTGIPSDSIEAARAIGIPVPVADKVVTDPDSGLSMACYMWFEPNTMDAYVTFAVLYGATAGILADTAQHVMEPSLQILRTA